MQKPKDFLKAWRDKLNEIQVLSELRNGFRLIGVQAVYAALLLFFAYKRSDTPSWAKRIILGSLAYLLAPLDLIPDLSPFFGFTDDLGVLMFGLVSIAGYIDGDVRTKARDQLQGWFGEVSQEDLASVDRQL